MITNNDAVRCLNFLESLEYSYGSADLQPHFDAIRKAIHARDHLRILRARTDRIYVSSMKKEAV